MHATILHSQTQQNIHLKTYKNTRKLTIERRFGKKLLLLDHPALFTLETTVTPEVKGIPARCLSFFTISGNRSVFPKKIFTLSLHLFNIQTTQQQTLTVEIKYIIFCFVVGYF